MLNDKMYIKKKQCFAIFVFNWLTLFIFDYKTINKNQLREGRGSRNVKGIIKRKNRKIN